MDSNELLGHSKLCIRYRFTSQLKILIPVSFRHRIDLIWALPIEDEFEALGIRIVLMLAQLDLTETLTLHINCIVTVRVKIFCTTPRNITIREFGHDPT